MKEKLSEFIGSDFAHLTTTEDENTIQADYVCSTAGKEDYAYRAKVSAE